MREVLTAMRAAPVPAESTAGIELASTTGTVAAAKVKALETRAEGKAGRGHRLPPRNAERRPDALREGKGEVDALW